jgi:hypothetical protein
MRWHFGQGRIVRKKIGLLCVGLLGFTSAAWADNSTSWFTLEPDSHVAEQDVPLGALFYHRRAVREGYARLAETYDVTPGKPEDGQLAPGALLYKTQTRRYVYFCSAKGLRQKTSGEVIGSALGYAAFGLVGALVKTEPRATSLQCFRDADMDGRFDHIAQGTLEGRDRFILTAAMGISIYAEDPLPAPLAYQSADQDSQEPPIELGLSAALRDAEKKSFDVSFCMQTHKSEFLIDELKCFDSNSVRVQADRLPKKIPLLGGEISIMAISQDTGGDWRVRYTVSKPTEATAIAITQTLRHYAIESGLQWRTAAGK